jgi:SAM-dependent methyltransferase
MNDTGHITSSLAVLLAAGCATSSAGGQGSTPRACSHEGSTHPHGSTADAEQPAFHHRFEDASHWASQWDTPERDEWQRPNDVMAALGLRPNAIVADIGAGTGYFSVRLARQVPSGRVYAVDVEPSMVDHLEQRAAREGIDNLQAVLASPSDPKLTEPVDLVLVCNTYHHIDARRQYFRRLRDRLRPGGRLVIVDYKKDGHGHGPPVQHRMRASEVVAELDAAGYRPVLIDQDLLPYQYMLVLEESSP